MSGKQLWVLVAVGCIALGCQKEAADEVTRTEVSPDTVEPAAPPAGDESSSPRTAGQPPPTPVKSDVPAYRKGDEGQSQAFAVVRPTHKFGKQTHVLPDVAKTPSPGGPVPMPYPNAGSSKKPTGNKPPAGDAPPTGNKKPADGKGTDPGPAASKPRRAKDANAGKQLDSTSSVKSTSGSLKKK